MRVASQQRPQQQYRGIASWVSGKETRAKRSKKGNGGVQQLEEVALAYMGNCKSGMLLNRAGEVEQT